MAPELPRVSLNVAKLPTSKDANWDGFFPVPFFVVMLITPPMASEPQTVLWGPLRISIFSMLSKFIFPNSNPPVVFEFAWTPSINTNV